jgi:hypothetical protein
MEDMEDLILIPGSFNFIHSAGSLFRLGTSDVLLQGTRQVRIPKSFTAKATDGHWIHWIT